MTTRELSGNPRVVRGRNGMEIQYNWGKVSRQEQKCRENCAFIVLTFGIGVLILAIGLCTGLLAPAHGLVGMVATWVVGFVAREYLETSEHDDTIELDVE